MSADAPELDDYRIAIFTRPEDPRALSGVFEQRLNLHPTDAMFWAHQAPGILTNSFSSDQARVLATGIGELGVQFSVIRTAEIPDLHHPLTAHHVRCSVDGLQIIGLYAVPENMIPWSAIQMVCVGETSLETEHRYSSGQWSGISAGHHYQSPGVSLPRTPSLQAWITCAAPFPVLRIDHEHMNYEYLGARQVDSSATNFNLFMHDLTNHATAALLTESTAAYLQHVEPERYRFRSEDDLIRYATLQALLARQQLATKPTSVSS